MGKNDKTAPLYKILLLYEDVLEPTSNVTEDDYLTYLDRIATYYLGAAQMEIYRYIRGLRSAGANLDKSTVKTIVFHICGLVKGGEQDAD